MPAFSPSAALDIAPEMQLIKEIRHTRAKQSKCCRHRQSQRKWRALKRRIGSLPQELQDDILELTTYFQPSEDNDVRITKRYKPPVGMQVSWHIRAKFVKAYYSNTISQMGSLEHNMRACGTLEGDSNQDMAQNICKQWLQSLIASERDLINTIRLDHRSMLPYNRMTDYSAVSFLRAFAMSYPDSLEHTGISSLRLRLKNGDGWHQCTNLPNTRSQLQNDWANARLLPPQGRQGDFTRFRIHHSTPPFSISPSELARQRLDREAEWNKQDELRNQIQIKTVVSAYRIVFPPHGSSIGSW